MLTNRPHPVLALLVLIAGCASAVSEPNPPGPPAPSPSRDRPFAGRIVVGSSALHEDVEDFDAAWLRRLEVVGVTAHITYDDDRAVFDVYGADPAALRGIAAVLLDPGGWRMESVAADGDLVWWSPRTGRAYVWIDRYVLCGFRGRTELSFSRAGTVHRVPAVLRWKGKSPGTDGPIVDVAHPGGGQCPEETLWPAGVTLELPADRAAATAILLAVVGGTLPAPPFLVGIEPAGGGS